MDNGMCLRVAFAHRDATIRANLAKMCWKIYNWADYIDEDVFAEFPEWYKEQTGEDIRIVYQTFDIK